MQTTEAKDPQLTRPGPIGLGIRVLLGATILYWFAALLTKWNGFLERDPIESGRLYTLFTIWWLPEVFALTFRRPWCYGRPWCSRPGAERSGWPATWPAPGCGTPCWRGGPTPATCWSGAPWPSRSRSPS